MTLSLSPNRRRGQPGLMTVTGAISNGVDWNETLTLTLSDGDQLTGVSSDTFALQLRSRIEDTSAVLSLTTDSELAVTEGADATTLGISVDASVVGALDPGDYIIDIVVEESTTTGHVAHGRISVMGAPIAI